MNANCPGCGRPLPAGHTLCVKCGARVDAQTETTRHRETTARRVALIAVAATLAIAGALVVIAIHWGGEPATSPPAPPGVAARAPAPREPAMRSGQRRALRPPRPDHRLRNTPPASRARPPRSRRSPRSRRPPPRRPGVIDRVRACVDARRAQAARRCGRIGRWAGQTAESTCLLGYAAKSYWVCLSNAGSRLGHCARSCATRSRGCLLSCISPEQRATPGGSLGCLWGCWRRVTDPCLGACLRP